MTTKLPNVSNTLPISSLPALASMHINSRDTDWHQIKPGLKSKLLFENKATGDRVLLFQSEPGHRSEPHSHKELEHVYVLSGSMFDDDHLMRAGDYCVRAPGTVHGGGSDEGATSLVVYTPINET